jgi:hypothetical protein
MRWRPLLLRKRTLAVGHDHVPKPALEASVYKVDPHMLRHATG